MNNVFIGIMSGTSFDGVDVVLVDFPTEKSIQVIDHLEWPMPKDLLNDLLTLSLPTPHSIEAFYAMDVKLADFYADAVLALLSNSELSAQAIRAIGCHGQTIRHFPNQAIPFTVQLGDPNKLVSRTGITTVCDFRRGDIARGGQGAPLAPAFHRAFFSTESENRVVLNIGGFSNITLLPKNGHVFGFDTGPGNSLMDAYMQAHCQQPFDKDGHLASQGTVCEPLLNELLAHPYFSKPAPKSTGRDEFNLSMIQPLLNQHVLSDKDNMATLTEFTARSIAQAILSAQPDTNTVYVCGGGAFNKHLMARLAALLPHATCRSTDILGFSPKVIEGCLMAWLAQQTLDRKPVDLRSITGSHSPYLLGGVYYAS